MSKRPVIGLEGMVSTLTVLKIGSGDFAEVERELRAKVQQLPNFFQDGPLVIDLGAIEGSLDDEEAASLSPLSLADLVGLMRSLSLLPLGIRNPRAARVEEAQGLGLAILRPGSVRPGRPDPTPSDELSRHETMPAPPPSTPPPARSVLLHTPVRGGQVVYAEGGDAIALSTVNSGGELIADGHVHIYGRLRGRAVAGVRGDTDARIFCQCLEAEVISIAGVFMGADDLPKSFLGKPVQIRLDDDTLVFEPLS